MANKNVYTIIMAGGVGSRFWPLSRKKFPKQFHDFLGTGKSLIQMTYERHLNVCPNENIYVVTNKDYYDLVKSHLPKLSDDQILLEPFGRNTAPCVAYAANKILSINENAKLIVCPSDHIITNENEYIKDVQLGLSHCSEDILITLGIMPSRPDTGYGYIKYIDIEKDLKKVKTFTEKPSLDIAQKFIESGDYVWNAGIFIYSVKSILKAFDEHLVDMNSLFKEIKTQYYTNNEQNEIDIVYSKCKSVSIDYGIMEKASNVYTILTDFGWSDLGTWNSVYEKREKDSDKNILDGNIIAHNVNNSIVKGASDKLLVIDGLDNYIVVDHENVLMICPKNEEQKVKEFVNQVQKEKGEDYI